MNSFYPLFVTKWFLRSGSEFQVVSAPKIVRIFFGVALAVVCAGGCGGGHSSSSTVPINTQQNSVIFESNRDGDFEILRMNQDGTDVTRVTNNTLNDTQPSVSNDGQRIAFVSNRTGNNEIFLIDAQGTRQLTNNTFDDNQPELSPDGQKVVFRSNRNGASDLFLVDAASRKETQLTASFDLEQNPTWTTDGRILFSSNAESDFFQLYSMNTSGEDIKPLLEPEDSNQITPSASRDGQHIVFVSDQTGNSDIFLLNLATKRVVQLTNDQRNNNRPVFSPDGQRIFFSSNREGNDDIYSMNLDGLDVQNLTNNPAIDRSPKVAPAH